MAADSNAIINQISPPVTQADYIKKVSEKSSGMASVNPSQQDVDAINQGMQQSLAGVLSDPKNAGLSSDKLAGLAVNHAMQDPHVAQAITNISVSGNHETFIGDVSGQIHDGIVQGAKQQIAEGIQNNQPLIAQMRQQKQGLNGAGQVNVAGNGSQVTSSYVASTGTPPGVPAGSPAPAIGADNQQPPVPSSVAAPKSKGSGQAPSAGAGGGELGAFEEVEGLLSHLPVVGGIVGEAIKGIETMIANNPELKQLMNELMSLPKMEVAHTQEHAPPTQVANVQQQQQSTGRG